MIQNYVFFVAGLGALAFGAELLVRGSSRLALALGVRPVVAGLTVVAFGTSMPEFFASFASALAGSEGIAIGNVVGSNVANVGIVAGLSALVRPLASDRATLRREVPFMILVSFVFLWFISDGLVSRLEGGVLFAGIVVFTVLSVVSAMRGAAVKADAPAPGGTRGGNAAMSAVGLAGLIAGAHFMVKGAVQIAAHFNVPEVIIGLSVVAVGTSLPELAASMAAAAHGESGICLGNVIGSNIFNILFVTGVVALAAPLHVERAMITQQTPAMIGFAAALALFMATGRRITRREGLLFVLSYAGFIVWIYGA